MQRFWHTLAFSLAGLIAACATNPTAQTGDAATSWDGATSPHLADANSSDSAIPARIVRAIWSDEDTGFELHTAGGPAIAVGDAGCPSSDQAAISFATPNMLSSVGCRTNWSITLSTSQVQQLRAQLIALEVNTKTMPCLHPPFEELTVLDQAGHAHHYPADYDGQCDGIAADGYIDSNRLDSLFELVLSFATHAGVAP